LIHELVLFVDLCALRDSALCNKWSQTSQRITKDSKDDTRAQFTFNCRIAKVEY